MRCPPYAREREQDKTLHTQAPMADKQPPSAKFVIYQQNRYFLL
jgi:hypothetical protein